MYATTIGKDYNVTGFSLTDKVNSPGERIITSINFYKGNSNYCAEIINNSIKLSDRDKKLDIAEFDVKTKKVWWYLSHCCEPERSKSESIESINSMIICPACKDPKLQDNFRNNEMLSFYGQNYSRKLLEALSKGILEFMQRFYDFCK